MRLLKDLARKILKAEIADLNSVLYVERANYSLAEKELENYADTISSLRSTAATFREQQKSLRKEAQEWYDKAQTYKAQAENNRNQPKPPPRELSQFDPAKVTIEDLKRQFYGGLFAIPGIEVIELKPQKYWNTYLIRLPVGDTIKEFFVKENLGVYPDSDDEPQPRLIITEVK